MQSSNLDSEEQKIVNEYRSNKFELLKDMKERKDAFIKQNDTIVGFIASHQDSKKETRVILDGTYLSPEHTSEHNEIFNKIFGYLALAHPNAKTVWGTTLKKNQATTEFIQKLGFTSSNYMDEIHNPTIFQGWKKNLN